MRQGLTVLAMWCAGLGAAAQFGKMSILFEDLGQRYAGHSAVALGLIVSIVGIVGLVLGTTAGLSISGLGQKRVVVSALFAGAVMSILQVIELPYAGMIASRIVEGVSHLAIVVVGPLVMSAAASDRYRGAAMTLWSSFVGLAYALLALFAPWDMEVLFLVHAAWMTACGFALMLLLPPDSPRMDRTGGGGSLFARHVEIYLSPRIAAPALGFFCYTFLYVALLTLLPPQIPDGFREFAASAMPAISIFVSLTLGVWLLSRLSPVTLVQLGYAVAVPGFVVLALGWGNGAVMTAAALWVSSALGLVQGASFASIPYLNETVDDRARAAGAVAQLGNLGTTTGTPILAAVLLAAGPLGLAVCATAACLLGIMLHAVQARRRQILST